MINIGKKTVIPPNYLDTQNIQRMPITQYFTASDGQTVFYLSSSYELGKNQVSVEVENVPQKLGDGFTETTNTSITLSEGVSAGTNVAVRIFATPDGMNAKLTSLDATSQSVVSQLANMVTNVKTPPIPLIGAKGDGVTDDTTALQNILNNANTNGGLVFIPAGTFKTSSPLTVNWSSSSKLTGIVGVGNQSVINGKITSDSRAILEILGTDNTNAVNLFIEKFTLLMDLGSSTKAYCLRVGDSRQFSAFRINCFGANGLLLKVATSSSYATINANFKECRFISNDSNRFYSDDTQAAVFAVNAETGGAYWDNVKFESCDFMGLVNPRAWVCEFDNCQFSTNPNRPVTDYSYNNNVNISIGNASFQHCYFEDHSVAVGISNGLSHVWNVSFDDCHFTGVSNYGGTGSVAIDVNEIANSYKLGKVSVSKARFGTYGVKAIRNTGSATVVIDDVTNLTDPSQPVPIQGEITPSKKEVVKFYGNINAANSTILGKVIKTSNIDTLILDRKCWLSSVKFVMNNGITAGKATVQVKKNGGTIVWEDYPTSTLFTNTLRPGYFEQGTIVNPNQQTLLFQKGDQLAVSIISDASFTPVNSDFEVWLELGY